MTKNSLDPLNDFTALYSLYIKLGGSPAEFAYGPRVWINFKVNRDATGRTGIPLHTVEIAEDFWRDFAALRARTLELKQKLVKPTENHTKPYIMGSGTSTG
jgi:hypothetical protein